MVQISKLIVGLFQVDCYIVSCVETAEAVIIDPGDEEGEILKVIKKKNLKIKHILLTHAHLDHVKSAGELQEELKVPVYLHPGDRFLLDDLPAQAAAFALPMPKMTMPDDVRDLAEGMEISFGQSSLKVMHSPGHSPGCVLFYSEADKALFAGDTLFNGSIGRTDLWQGNYQQLINSVKDKIFTLPDDVTIYPGHGPETVIGYEKESNPFF